MTAPINVGVVSVVWGQTFARGAGPHLGQLVVALCDTWEDHLNVLYAGKHVMSETSACFTLAQEVWGRHGLRPAPSLAAADAVIHHVPYPAHPSGAPL